MNPVGLIVTALIVGGAVALRLGSGKTYEQMGDELNNMLLGDMDEQARAKMTVRHRMQGDELLTRIRAQSGAGNAQINRIAEDLFRVEKQYEDGKAMIERAFPVNNTIDMLVLRASDAFKRAWQMNGSQEKFDRMVEKATENRLGKGRKRLGR